MGKSPMGSLQHFDLKFFLNCPQKSKEKTKKDFERQKNGHKSNFVWNFALIELGRAQKRQERVNNTQKNIFRCKFPSKVCKNVLLGSWEHFQSPVCSQKRENVFWKVEKCSVERLKVKICFGSLQNLIFLATPRQIVTKIGPIFQEIREIKLSDRLAREKRSH